MSETAAQELWDFALDFYGGDGVRNACLRLQEDAGADVLLLIFLCFAGTRGQAFPIEHLLKIEDETALWRRGVIEHLRAARRVLGSRDEDASRELREMVRNAELEAERLQMARLSRYLTEPSAAPFDAKACADAGMQAYAMLVPAIERRHLAILLAKLP